MVAIMLWRCFAMRMSLLRLHRFGLLTPRRFRGRWRWPTRNGWIGFCSLALRRFAFMPLVLILGWAERVERKLLWSLTLLWFPLIWLVTCTCCFQPRLWLITALLKTFWRHPTISWLSWPCACASGCTTKRCPLLLGRWQIGSALLALP